MVAAALEASGAGSRRRCRPVRRERSGVFSTAAGVLAGDHDIVRYSHTHSSSVLVQPTNTVTTSTERRPLLPPNAIAPPVGVGTQELPVVDFGLDLPAVIDALRYEGVDRTRTA